MPVGDRKFSESRLPPNKRTSDNVGVGIFSGIVTHPGVISKQLTNLFTLFLDSRRIHGVLKTASIELEVRVLLGV